MNLLSKCKLLWAAASAAVMTSSLKPMEGALETLQSDNKGITGLIITGILTTIIGFVMLIIGIYIYYTVQTTLPALASSSYNSTVTTINTYAGTVFPLMGIVLMVMGFVIILIALKMAGGGIAPGTR